ncbi:FAD/NAD(P)-binding protein [Alkalibacterium iburiense]|uniref:FAD/NAD(P)-binding protein n=1 Tax=Alkalibacterium iburiense TaxID=290589 RepID=A0ABN0X1S4_9LACT
MKIAIIGMGVAGVSLIREIKKQLSQTQLKKVELIIFSDSELFGTGLPYQQDDSALVLNQYAESMTIDPSHPTDFLQWIEQNKPITDAKSLHVPRAWFGEYVKERLEEWLIDLPVTVIYQKVTRIRAIGDHASYLIETKDYIKKVDVVHLAVGHLAYQDPFQLKGLSQYVYHPYPATKQLAFETKKASIGILGSRLTALDAMHFLKKKNPEATFHFFSLDSKFSSIRGYFPDTLLTKEKKDAYLNALLQTDRTLTLKGVEEWFIKIGLDYQINIKWIWENLGSGDIEGLKKDLHHLKELGRFQKLIGELKETFPYIWLALPDSEKRVFKKHRELHFSRFKIPIPQKVAQDILDGHEEGKIRMHNAITSINHNEKEFLIHTQNEKPTQIDYLINATGQRTHLLSQTEHQQPLIRQLLEDKLVLPYPFGGVAIDYPSMSIKDGTGKVRPFFKVYGQLASGIQIGNTNVDLVSQSAITGVQSMLEASVI